MRQTRFFKSHHRSGACSFNGMASVLASVCALVVLGGCASSDVRNHSANQVNTNVEARSVVVKVSSGLESLDKEVLFVKALIISGLNDTNRFRAVPEIEGTPPPENGMKLNVDIVEFSGVSQTKRDVLGAFAGRAGIRLHVTVLEMTSGNQIRDFEAVGKSGLSNFSGNTPEAIQLATQQVVDEMLQISGPKAR